AGVVRVDGSFERGDAVEILGPGNIVLARGLAAYPSEDARLIAGHRTDEIETLLGWRGRDEIVHRDDLVLMVAGAA
ncbi:MAG: PUA domain-containing protein, partial [Terriglobales bacterium]